MQTKDRNSWMRIGNIIGRAIQRRHIRPHFSPLRPRIPVDRNDPKADGRKAAEEFGKALRKALRMK